MRTVLYLGVDPSHFFHQGRLIHYPVIKLKPRPRTDAGVQSALSQFDLVTHILFTSQHAVRFFHHLQPFDKLGEQKICIAIGKMTAEALKRVGRAADWVSPVETQEGLIELLRKQSLDGAYLLLPRSSRSRPVLIRFFQQAGMRHFAFDLYDTVLQQPGPAPSLDEVDEIVFTSPSTVEGFLKIYGRLPENKELQAMGPITRAAIDCVRLL